MTYWYCEYIENGVDYCCIGTSNDDKPDILKLVPKIGENNTRISILFEISHKSYNNIYSKMSKFHNLGEYYE